MSDAHLAIGAGVGIVLLLLFSVKLYREGREMDELAKDEAAGRFLRTFFRAHPEGRPLPAWQVVVVFVALLCAAVALFVASRM